MARFRRSRSAAPSPLPFAGNPRSAATFLRNCGVLHQKPIGERAPVVGCVGGHRRQAAVPGTPLELPCQHAPGIGGAQICGGDALMRHQCVGHDRRKRGGNFAELAGNLGDERGLQRGAEPVAIIEVENSAPLVAPGQHGGQKLDGFAGIVVQMGEYPLPMRIVGAGGGERVARRPCVQRIGAFLVARGRAQPRGERRLPRESRAQRVDGLHGKTRRMRGQLPVVPGILREDVDGERARALLVR